MLKNGENNQIDNDAQSSNQKKKWYQKKSVQIAAIIIVGIGVIGSIFNPEKEEKSKPANISSSKALSSVLESSSALSSLESSNTLPSSELSEKIDRDQILANDDSIYLYVLKSEKITNTLREAIVSFGNEEISSLELYNLAKKAKESQLSFFSGLTDLQNDYNKDYLEACKMYVSNGRELANDLIKYLDKNKMKDLSSAQECLESIDAYTLSVVTQRMTYLANCGISDEEITEILQKPSPVDEPLVNGE